MKKNFPFEITGLKPARAIDSIKNEVRKYVKRERKKTLPEGVDFWDFDCRTGAASDTAVVTHITKITDAIDAAASANQPGIYIEILAKHGVRAGTSASTADYSLSSSPPSESSE